jgi:hypothetical protein
MASMIWNIHPFRIIILKYNAIAIEESGVAGTNRSVIIRVEF